MRYPASYPEILSRHFHTRFFVDLETTGLDTWRNEILTMSLSALDFYTHKTKGSIDLTFKPRNLQYWSKEAEKEVHKISISQALYFDDKVASTKRFLEFFGDFSAGRPQILVCHAFDKYRKDNLFDVAMIMVQLEKMGLRHHLYQSVRFFESTETYFREARRQGYYPRHGDLLNNIESDEGEDFKLKTLCKRFKIKLKRHHHATDDRVACEELYKIADGFGGNNDRESSFDLQEPIEWNASEGSENRHVELQDRDRWNVGADQVSRTDQDPYICGEED